MTKAILFLIILAFPVPGTILGGAYGNRRIYCRLFAGLLGECVCDCPGCGSPKEDYGQGEDGQ